MAMAAVRAEKDSVEQGLRQELADATARADAERADKEALAASLAHASEALQEMARQKAQVRRSKENPPPRPLVRTAALRRTLTIAPISRESVAC